MAARQLTADGRAPSLKRATLILALSLGWIAIESCLAEGASRPIIDVRFDAPYSQIIPSNGDEWAPTWGPDDVLYTGNDDGNSFGGIPQNAVAFGKLEGDDPYRLKGISLSSMESFREPELPGPEHAAWKTVDSFTLGGTRYRFAACGTGACLVSSTDQGATWSAAIGTPLFPNSGFPAPSFITFRKGYEFLYPLGYVYVASYAGVIGTQDAYVLARISEAQLAHAHPSDWTFAQDDYSWTSDEQTASLNVNNTQSGADGTNWKVMNSYSVDGVLYMFVTRCQYASLTTRHVFRDASIIKSTDGGRTWTRSGAQNLDKPMFPGTRFGAAYFVWYGKDGTASIDNADRYVYAISNNGHFENGDDYVLGRVPKTKLSDLSAADWTFYTSGDGMLAGSWTRELNEAGTVLNRPGRAGMTGMTYLGSLGRYAMVLWHYNQDNFAVGVAKKDLSTELEFFEAPKPWGPWNRIRSFKTGRLGWYTPIIGQRFQRSTDADTVHAFLYATGFDVGEDGVLDLRLTKLNYMPITLSRRPLLHNDPALIGGR